MNTTRSSRQSGFTIIELLVVIVIACILTALVVLTYSGVQAKNRNSDRQQAIDTVKGQLESYYASTNTYPTFTQLNDATWRAQNLKHLPSGILKDPRWNKANKNCTTAEKPTTSTKPAANCYGYQVTATDGSACDNQKVPCAHYTLTAMLEGGEQYAKSSLN
ncbi:MAG TPA: type II secretion system protein [Bacillota bacterium]|nr:type II secretion system protein [Bacillota bacterium]